jgi:anthranilate/para-aminobenzoate synthase component II
MGQAFGGDVVPAQEIMHGKVSEVTHAAAAVSRLALSRFAPRAIIRSP